MKSISKKKKKKIASAPTLHFRFSLFLWCRSILMSLMRITAPIKWGIFFFLFLFLFFSSNAHLNSLRLATRLIFLYGDFIWSIYIQKAKLSYMSENLWRMPIYHRSFSSTLIAFYVRLHHIIMFLKLLHRMLRYMVINLSKYEYFVKVLSKVVTLKQKNSWMGRNYVIYPT